MRVPHPWIENIDGRARTMLYRNFAEIEAALGGGFTTFTTVADDGTGDYTTIKAAVEAVPNDGAAFIYVKPHSAGGYYDDTVYGNVTLNRRVKIVVWAATDFNYRQRALSGTKIGTPPRERWDCLSITFAGNELYEDHVLFFHGLDIRHSGSMVTSGKSTLTYGADSCVITASNMGPEPDDVTITAAMGRARLFVFNGTNVQLAVATNTNLPTVLANDCAITLTSMGSGASATREQPNALIFSNCVITMGASTTLKSSGGAAGGLVRFDNCLFDQDGSLTIDGYRLEMVGCTYLDAGEDGLTALTVTATGTYASSNTYRRGVVLVDNALPGTQVTLSSGKFTHVSGQYKTLNIATSGGNYDVHLDPDKTNSLTLLTVSGSNNMIKCSLGVRRTPAPTGTVGGNVTGNNNTILGAYGGLTVTDGGSGNTIGTGAGATQLNELSDVEPTLSPSTGDVFRYDGTVWDAAALAGLAPAGGASGYVLTKNTATDYDYSWAAPGGGGGGDDSFTRPFLVMGG